MCCAESYRLGKFNSWAQIPIRFGRPPDEGVRSPSGKVGSCRSPGRRRSFRSINYSSAGMQAPHCQAQRRGGAASGLFHVDPQWAAWLDLCNSKPYMPACHAIQEGATRRLWFRAQGLKALALGLTFGAGIRIQKTYTRPMTVRPRRYLCTKIL